MKREREEEEGAGAAMSPPSLRPPSAASSFPRVSGGPMKGPIAFHSLRAPSPIVRAMRTRLDPPPSLHAPPPSPLPPPPLLLQTPAKRPRGRPRNCDRLPPPPGFLPTPPARAPPPLPAHARCQWGGLQPHVLRIDVGEDIVSRIVHASRKNGKAICVLSVLGSVQEAKLLHASRVILNHKGPLEIIRMFGSILTPEGPGFRCLSVTLACADCSVVGGVIAGPLIATTTVQAIVGTFSSDAFQTKKTPKIIAHYPDSQLVTGYGASCYPNSQVPNGHGIRHDASSQVTAGTESRHCDDSQVDTGNGSTDRPSSHVPICDGSTLYSSSKVVNCKGNTAYPSSEVVIGNGNTRHLNPQVVFGNWSTYYLNSLVPIGDGSMHHSNSQITVGGGTIHHPNSLVTDGVGGTHVPDSQVPVVYGSTHQTDSHLTNGDGSTSNSDCLVDLDNGSICNPKSEASLASGRISDMNHGTTFEDNHACNLHLRVVSAGDESTPFMKVAAEQVTVEKENTYDSYFKVSIIDNGSSHYPSSNGAAGEGITLSIGSSASCIAVQQDVSTEVDVKASDVSVI